MRLVAALAIIASAMTLAAGCSYSTRSGGLPDHIRTIEVPTVKAPKIFYYGIESKLTREIIRWVNNDPQVRVVNIDGDAILAVEIKNVTQKPIRETKQDRPATMQLTIKVAYSLYDQVEQRYLIQGEYVSSQLATAAGLYEIERGEVRAAAEDRIAEELAREIVRRTLGHWSL